MSNYPIISNPGFEVCYTFDTYVKHYNDVIKKKKKEDEIKIIIDRVNNAFKHKNKVNSRDIQKYNILINMDVVMKEIDNFGKSRNKFSKERANALKDGRTMQYYAGHRDDTEFIPTLKKIVEKLSSVKK